MQIKQSFGDNDSGAEIQRKVDEIDASQKAKEFPNLQKGHAMQLDDEDVIFKEVNEVIKNQREFAMKQSALMKGQKTLCSIDELLSKK